MLTKNEIFFIKNDFFDLKNFNFIFNSFFLCCYKKNFFYFNKKNFFYLYLFFEVYFYENEKELEEDNYFNLNFFFEYNNLINSDNEILEENLFFFLSDSDFENNFYNVITDRFFFLRESTEDEQDNFLEDFEQFKPKKKKVDFNINLYKYLFRELINFDENDFFYKMLPNNYSFYGFISNSYYNFYLNNNFFDDRVFEKLFSSENYKDYVFNNFNNLNLKFQDNNLYVYNNHYPILLNSNLIDILFFSKKNKLDHINYSKFYKFYISNLFEIILRKSIFFKLDTNFFKKYSHFFQVDKIVSNTKNPNNIAFSKSFYISEMVEIIWYSFEFKDLNILSNWLTKTLAQINLKNHKKFLNLFVSVIKNNIDDYQHLLKINGFFFKIKGKIALTGNAKKKQMKYRFGKLYISDKKNKIILEKNISKTDYGVLGFTMVLTY